MPCPFFLPEGKLETGPWTHAPRLPLGTAYKGTCQACAGESFQPPEAHVEEWCNRGYARGLCERFPEASPADAVRFSITAEEPSRLRLVYVFERDHAPAEFGALEFSIAENVLVAPDASERLKGQAEAFVRNHLLTECRDDSRHRSLDSLRHVGG